MTLSTISNQRPAKTKPIPRVTQVENVGKNIKKSQQKLSNSIKTNQTSAIRSNNNNIAESNRKITYLRNNNKSLQAQLSSAQKQNPTAYANAEYKALITQGKKFNFTFKNGVFYDNDPLSAFDINAEERADELEWLNRKARELQKKYPQRNRNKNKSLLSSTQKQNPITDANAKYKAYYTLWGNLSGRQEQDNYHSFKNNPKIKAFIKEYSNDDIVLNEKRGVFEFKSGPLAFIDGTNEDIDLDWINSEFQILLNRLAKGKKQQILDSNLTAEERKRIYGKNSQKQKHSPQKKPQPKTAASALLGNTGAPTKPTKPTKPTRLPRKAPINTTEITKPYTITMKNIDKEFSKLNNSIQAIKTTKNQPEREKMKKKLAEVENPKYQKISPQLARETMFYAMKTIEKPFALKIIFLKLLQNIPQSPKEKEEYITSLEYGITANGIINKKHPLYAIQQIFLSKNSATDEKISQLISATEKIKTQKV